jgi:two-component system LytT family sensor kinase
VPALNKPVRHIFYWAIPYIAVCILQASAPDQNYSWFPVVTGCFIVAAGIIYINLFLCKKFFFTKKSFYFTGILILYIIYLIIVYFSGKDEHPINPLTERPLKLFALIFFFTLYFLVLVLLSFVYWSVTVTGKKNKELLAAQMQLQQFETDKNDAEKKFLRSQINPHFLYNTLNYYYSKALLVSPELAESLLLLSDIMRYSLELKENEQGLVPLTKEIEHIKNIIKINQYRFSNRLQIKFLITGTEEAVCIAPLALITFVENAFKHAELLDPQQPVSFMLDISHADQKIYFKVHNKIKKGPKEHSTGIGLANTERRLKFIYSEKYEMKTTEDKEFYTASLTLPLYTDHSI